MRQMKTLFVYVHIGEEGNMMQQLLVNRDTASLGYWLDWRVFFCGTMVIFFMFIAFFLLWKYEWLAGKDDSGGQYANDQRQWEEEKAAAAAAWRPCVKEVNPFCLMAFRLVSFCLLLATFSCHVVVYGGSLFYYYTQWTFTLVTIYFGFGSVLSMYGCSQYIKATMTVINDDDDRWKEGLEDKLLITESAGEYCNGDHHHHVIKRELTDDCHKTDMYPERAALLCGYVFQVLFQIGGGAVVLTDIVYWFVIFPTLDDSDLTFLTVVAHTLNMLLLGDASLNCLPFPWFRIAYFIFWTAAYVLSQWIVHAFQSIWWPYPFLDLSTPNAPLWYLVVALMHIPCYGTVVLLVELKKWVLSTYLPSYVMF
ncbi:unnamed protein product [Cuscuta europaea]|uniref:Transmembrane protein n=1 Tax=Cuscuta europaea TaxID=41803 RepID=A0A9P0ZUF8_CUSEU|nr:unnamed protein product [Cuscuta europaea]